MVAKLNLLAFALLGLLLLEFRDHPFQQVQGKLEYQPQLSLGRGTVLNAAWRPDGKAVAHALAQVSSDDDLGFFSDCGFANLGKQFILHEIRCRSRRSIERIPSEPVLYQAL